MNILNIFFKYAVSLFFLAGSYRASGQGDFFSLYRKIDNMSRRLEGSLPSVKAPGISDTAAYFAVEKTRIKFHADSIAPLLKQVGNLSFPDIYFTDANDKSWSVSDFSGKDVIINYNYLYCMTCVGRIDSTLKRIRSRNVKMIVLVSDIYIRELSDLDAFKDEVLVGYINTDNLDLISLKQGDDCMYYLDKNRQIEFFDRAHTEDHRQAWLTFLDNRFK